MLRRNYARHIDECQAEYEREFNRLQERVISEEEMRKECNIDHPRKLPGKGKLWRLTSKEKDIYYRAQFDDKTCLKSAKLDDDYYTVYQYYDDTAGVMKETYKRTTVEAAVSS